MPRWHYDSKLRRIALKLSRERKMARVTFKNGKVAICRIFSVGGYTTKPGRCFVDISKKPRGYREVDLANVRSIKAA